MSRCRFSTLLQFSSTFHFGVSPLVCESWCRHEHTHTCFRSTVIMRSYRYLRLSVAALAWYRSCLCSPRSPLMARFDVSSCIHKHPPQCCSTPVDCTGCLHDARVAQAQCQQGPPAYSSSDRRATKDRGSRPSFVAHPGNKVPKCLLLSRAFFKIHQIRATTPTHDHNTLKSVFGQKRQFYDICTHDIAPKNWEIGAWLDTRSLCEDIVCMVSCC